MNKIQYLATSYHFRECMHRYIISCSECFEYTRIFEIYLSISAFLSSLYHLMPTRVPTIIPQSSYIPHPITRLWLCIECHIHAFTTQFNRFSILTYYCWYRVTFPEYPCPGSSIWLIRSLCDVCICPGFAIACYVDSDNIPSSTFILRCVSFFV